jgi:GDPmannose 4,6-dehydratase
MGEEKNKIAFITGIAGQDGSYLTEYLLELGYEVHGMVRRNSIAENQQSRLAVSRLNPNFHVYYGDLIDQTSIERLLTDIKPDEIYNLGAQSHVRVSFDIPQFTVQTNAVGVVNMLEAYRRLCPNAKFYQASSSEMFGLTVEDDGFQRETSVMNPVSPYGCAKVFAYNMVRHYRRAYGLHATNGILFNHESPRRGSNFVTNKVVKTAVQIKLGLVDKLELGNMDSYRDWGHSKDYVKAMHKVINHEVAEDFCISTMENYSVREMCDVVFKYLGMDYKDYVVQNKKYMRPEELPYLKGDSTKARTILDWEPTYTFKEMMHEMCDHWLDVLQNIESTR